MALTMPRRPFGYNGGVSQSHRDVTENRYKDLRHPRRVKFFCNGNRYFDGKLVHITPHRYITFNDLLNDLTSKLPSHVHLPYGVRNIYTPVGGRKVRDIDEFQDGQHYVCGGFEKFSPLKYGGSSREPWAPVGKPHHHDFFGDLYANQQQPHQQNFASPPTYRFSNNAFYPQRVMRGSYPRRAVPGTFGNRAGNGSYWASTGANAEQQVGGAAMKPKVITVIRNSERPRDNVKILLNRRSVQSYEQLVKDISEAFGPKWKNNKVKRLFTLKGREVMSVSDFFRDDDIFLGLGAGEYLAYQDVQDLLEEMYPDNPYAQNMVKEWEKNKKRQRLVILKKDSRDDGKKDSGLGSDSSNKDEDDPLRMEKERQRYAEQEREKARKRMQKRRDAERKALEEERRKKGLTPLRPLNESRKALEDKENDWKNSDLNNKSQSSPRKPPTVDDEGPKVIVVVKDDPRKSRVKNNRKKVDGYESDNESLSGKKYNEPEPEPSTVRTSKEIERIVKEEESTIAPKEKSKSFEQPENEKTSDIEEIKEKEDSPKRIHSSLEDNDISKNDDDQKDDNKNDINNGNGPEEREVKAESPPPKEETDIKQPEPEPEPIVMPEKTIKPEKPKENLKEETVVSVKSPRPKTPSSKGRALVMKEKTPKPEERKKPRSKSVIRKTKLERQISNLDHVHSRYEPGKTLGDGNFAVVKQCKLKNTKNEYAMKIIDKAKLKGKENMIENEIEIMKLCSHPSIVKLIEEFETKKEIYLIMELVKGGDLFDAITQSVKFGEKESASMTTDLCNALFYLHSRHIVHRDLKPENLLVCRNKDNSISLKLADFGLAMEVTENIYTVCGTPTYVAPEILAEIGYGLEVDMWACGVITYILLCGFPPFRSPDRNQTELFEFIKAGEYEFLSPYWDGISRSAKDLIERLLVVDRKKRYTAIDTLCHPWVLTLGGSLKLPGNTDDHRKSRRQELETQAKMNRESFLSLKDEVKAS